MKPQYLRVRNWEKFQHYKNRRPPWIKFHVSLLDDHTLSSLPLNAQLVYDRLLLWAAKTDNNIEHDPDWLSGKINVPPLVIQESIEILLDAGFLMMTGRKRHASKAIAKRYGASSDLHDFADSEAEAEAEKAETKAEADQNVGGIFPVPASADLETEIQKLLSLNGCDANTRTVVAVYARKLPLATVADIRCRAQEQGKGVGWAVNALKGAMNERSVA